MRIGGDVRGAEVIAVEVGDAFLAEGRDPQSARKEVLGGRHATHLIELAEERGEACGGRLLDAPPIPIVAEASHPASRRRGERGCPGGGGGHPDPVALACLGLWG